ncbi:MAG: transposase [Balneolales bacterium]|nr:transposase [Balneolales bacterium]
MRGDTPKQLLARCCHSLSQPRVRWKLRQSIRVSFAFQCHSELEAAYNHSQKLLLVYNGTCVKKAKQGIQQWIDDTYTYKMNLFYSCAKSLYYHLETIVNYFNNRSTNASAESFNAKVKLFRANQRGVVDVTYFLFRLSKLFG